ncbi:hypothetical protein JCM10212_002193 [Sporobolomyces blumeae]
MIPSLPHEVMLLIFDFLDESARSSRIDWFDDTALAEQRQIGPIISLVSRNFVAHGQAIVWRSVLLDASEGRLARSTMSALTTNPHLAQKVTRLLALADGEDVYRIRDLDFESLLLTVPNLSYFGVDANPHYVQRSLNPPSLAQTSRLAHLVLHTSSYGGPYGSTPPSYFLMLQELLPSALPHLESLHVRVGYPASGLDLSSSASSQHARHSTKLHSVKLEFESASTDESERYAAEFLKAFLGRIDSSLCPLASVSIASECPPHSLAAFIATCSLLNDLSIECSSAACDSPVRPILAALERQSSPRLQSLVLRIDYATETGFQPPAPFVDLVFNTIASLGDLRAVDLDFDLAPSMARRTPTIGRVTRTVTGRARWNPSDLT